jgi:serine/threonine protein kinase
MAHEQGPEETGPHSYRYIGNYELIRRLGRGGSSSVYLARHRILTNRPLVAIKHLWTPLDSEEARLQFIEEARLLEQLQHPHILPLIDAGIDENDCPYLVTAYAAGGSLRARLRRAPGRPLPLAEALTILAQIGEALQYAHERGVIHRDLKPENILFTEQGEALLADFGIAFLLGSRSLQSADVSGTPAYMAPEQFRGQVSRQSDQYALACVAYELCTGRRVFEDRDILVLMDRHTHDQPLPPRRYNPELPLALEAAILRALAKERSARYPDVASFVAALVAGASGEGSSLMPTPKQRAGRASWSPPVEAAEGGAGGIVAADPTRSGLSKQSIVPALPLPAGEELETPGRPPAAPGLAPALVSLSAAALPGPGVVAEPTTPPPGSARRPAPVSWRRRWLALPLVLLLLLLAAGVVLAYADPEALGPLGPVLPFGAPLAMVTITPQSVDLKNQYLITGVTGTPQATQREVQARQISSRVPSQPQTVPATGHGMTPGTQAHGTMTFLHAGFAWESVLKGTTFTLQNGLQITTDETVSLPPISGPGQVTSGVAPAHVVQPGSAGNLPAGVIRNQPCCGTTDIWATSGAFSGGQDPQPYTFVQQSDLDGVAKPIEAGLLQQAQQQFRSQIHGGEQLVNGASCAPAIKSDHQVGDHASSVTVTVIASCTGEVYDAVAALRLGQSLLTQEATNRAGSAYVLSGQVVTTISRVTVLDPRAGTLSIIVSAEGLWVYQFSEAQKQALVRLIAGKPRNTAVQLLQQQPGVRRADIRLAHTQGDLLPADPDQISITIVNLK